MAQTKTPINPKQSPGNPERGTPSGGTVRAPSRVKARINAKTAPEDPDNTRTERTLGSHGWDDNGCVGPVNLDSSGKPQWGSD